MPLPSPQEQLERSIGYLVRDGVVLIKDRPGNVADLVERWATERGLGVTRTRRPLGRAWHWEIRLERGGA